MRASLLLPLTVVALTGCQSAPRAAAGFSDAQVAVLRANGFHADGNGDWSFGLGERVLFAVDQSDLLPATAIRLRQLGGALSGVAIRAARVEGHTDRTGSAAHNLDLSERRARAVAEPLAAGGMDAAQLRVKGWGAQHPVESNGSRDGRRENRRVVIIVSPAPATGAAPPR